MDCLLEYWDESNVAEPTNSYKMSTYEEQGYIDRDDYLNCLACDYDMDLNTVTALAELLGPNEDFDGLIASIEDMI